MVDESLNPTRRIQMNRTMLWLLIGWTTLSLSACSDNPNQASSDPPPVTQENPNPPGNNTSGSNTPGINETAGDETGQIESTTPVAVMNPPVVTTTPPGGASRVLSILDAAKKGNVRAIEAALERGESANEGDDKMKVTPLMKAATQGCVECMEVLLEAGAEIDARNSSTATALMMASMTGPIRSVKFLLDNGADPNLATPSGRDALSVANERGDGDRNKAMIIILLERARRPNK